MTIRYFQKVKNRVAELEWLIDRQSIESEYDEDANAGIISGNIIFKDGSVFQFKEILLEKDRHYRFHYMDGKNNLIFRWDTAPHYKNLMTFPYHVHFPEGVKESKQVALIDILDKIKSVVVDSLERTVPTV